MPADNSYNSILPYFECFVYLDFLRNYNEINVDFSMLLNAVCAIFNSLTTLKHFLPSFLAALHTPPFTSNNTTNTPKNHRFIPFHPLYK